MLELRNVSYSVEENSTQKEIIKNINVIPKTKETIWKINPNNIFLVFINYHL